MIHQQRFYEDSYSIDIDDYGMPDRKISDGLRITSKNILSIGSGTGSDIWYLVKDNSIIGLDYSINGLKIGNQHGFCGVVGELNLTTTLPFEDKSFDIVICKDILEHILQPLEILQDVYRILRDDGFVIVSVPNYLYLSQRLRLLLGKELIWKSFGIDHSINYDSWNYMHVRFFTYASFRRFIFCAGFKPEKWFWDFGTLAHYQNPDMWIEPQNNKIRNGQVLSSRGKLGVLVIRPLWKIVNIIFPHIIREKFVALAPGIMCAGFYVRIRKQVVED